MAIETRVRKWCALHVCSLHILSSRPLDWFHWWIHYSWASWISFTALIVKHTLIIYSMYWRTLPLLGFCVLTEKKVLFTNKPIAASNAIACSLATPSDIECQRGRQIKLAHSSRFVSPRNLAPSMDKNWSYISACTLIGTYHVIHEW